MSDLELLKYLNAEKRYIIMCVTHLLMFNDEIYGQY